MIINIQRRIHLLDQSVFHDTDTITHRHRFDLVMRHIDHRRFKTRMEFADLRTHLDAHLRVKIGKRFVEQEHFRLAHDSASHRDTLPLTAGKRFRLAVEEAFDTQNLSRRSHTLVDIRFRKFS